MLSEAYQRVATLQFGSNCYSFIAIFVHSALLRSSLNESLLSICETSQRRDLHYFNTLRCEVLQLTKHKFS